MDIMKPEIDDLLEKTEQNPFLLCAIASKRATDINNMLHGQRLRVADVQGYERVTEMISSEDPISIALEEIADGSLTFDQVQVDEELAEADPND